MNTTLIYLITTDNGELPEFANQERLLAVVNNAEDLEKIVDKHHQEERNFQADESIPQYQKEMYTVSIRTEEITMNKLIN